MGRIKANDELYSDKTKNPVVRDTYVLHGNQWLDEVVDGLATDTGKKANRDYVDAELAKKANVSTVTELTNTVNTKANASTVTELAKTVDTKASTADVTVLQTKTAALETTVSGKADNTTVSSLSERVTENTTKTVDLQSQIDSLVIEAGGDSNPEVVQARTDVSGVTHATLKNRIDSEVTDLKSDVSELKSDNIQIPTPLLDNGRYLSGYPGYEGTEQGDTNSAITKYVKVIPDTKLKLEGVYLDGNRSVCGYNNSKTLTGVLIKGTTKKNVVIAIPSDVEYIRATCRNGVAPKISYANIVNEKIIEMQSNIKKIGIEVDALFESDIYIESIFNGRFVSAYEGYEGTEQGDANSAVTGFVNVIPNRYIEIDSVYLEGSRSICGYNSANEFVSVLATNISDTNVIVKLPENVSKIKITSKSGIKPTARYRSIDLYKPNVININNVDLGYINSTGKSIVSSSEYKHTDYIEVVGGSRINITYLATPLQNILFVFDENKNLVTVAKDTTTREIHNYTYALPLEAKYIRFNTYRNTASIQYVDGLEKHQKVFNLYDDYFKKTNGNIVRPFSHAMEHPCISVIDDDTWDAESITMFKDFCNNLGIKGSYACLTSRLEANESLVAQLKQCEKEGFPIITHGYTQGDFYDSNPEKRNLAECESDLVRGMHDMQKFGFANCNIWCTPFGASDRDLQDLAQKLGFIGLISSGWEGNGIEYLPTMDARRRYKISRNTFDAKFLQTLKNTIDLASATNGWILITTHFAKNECRTEAFAEAFADFVTYAKNHGCKFKTVNEELRKRMPVYNFFEAL